MITTSLCYIFNKNNQVLLIYKKRGFGQGLWNGAGGKVETGESIETSVIREVEEETGLKVSKLQTKGCLEFVWPEIPNNNNLCHLFTVEEFEGDFIESEECRPQWFNLDQIPYEEMWDDDKFWFPDLLSGKVVRKKIIFGKNNKVKKIKDI